MIIRFPRNTRETLLIDNLNLTLVSTTLAILISFFFIDIPVAQYFKSIPPFLLSSAHFGSTLIDPQYQLLAWPILFFIFRILLKKEQLANRCLLILVSIAISNFLCAIIKQFLGRARPELFFSHQDYGFILFNGSSLYTSFPSSHACVMGAICGVIAHFFPRHWILSVFLGFVLAMTRVILTSHYLSDIIAGEVLGFLTAQWVYKVMKKEYILFPRR